MDLYKPSVISDLLSRYGFSFSKGLGQNFLINPDICPKMADMCGAGKNDGVIEIGPGMGVLTSELACIAKRVVAVELDDRLFPILRETLSDYPNTEVIHGDAMKIDFHSLISEKFSDCEKVYVCANLPYYITSPVIMRLLEEKLPIAAVTVMVQKEAADRLAAPVGSRESGAVTVAVAYYSSPVMLFKVNRGSFMPPPNVDSAVIRLNIRADGGFSGEDNRQLFFRVVRAGFGQRRKTLANALSSGGFDKASVSSALSAAGLPPTVRAESLKMEDWLRVTELLSTSL